MADRPILFSGPMVRALLDGRKTQTRRVINPQPYDFVTDGKRYWNASGCVGGRICISDQHLASLHRRAVGDRLYVREAWHAARSLDRVKPRDIPRDADIEHAATARSYAEIGLKGRQRPGIHMPRWASRLTLTVTDVRVERLNDCSEVDAIAEGVAQYPCEGDGRGPGATYWTAQQGADISRTTPVAAYAALWDSINGAGAWDANPWVIAISFTVEQRNIDG